MKVLRTRILTVSLLLSLTACAKNFKNADRSLPHALIQVDHSLEKGSWNNTSSISLKRFVDCEEKYEDLGVIDSDAENQTYAVKPRQILSMEYTNIHTGSRLRTHRTWQVVFIPEMDHKYILQFNSQDDEHINFKFFDELNGQRSEIRYSLKDPVTLCAGPVQ